MPPDAPSPEGDASPVAVAKGYMADMGLAHEPSPSGPLKGTKPIADPGRTKRHLAQSLAQAERIMAGAEARVELLVHALNAANEGIPGVESWKLRHAVTGNGPNIISYLTKRFFHVPALAQQVQVACYRYFELMEAVKEAKAVLARDEASLEVLEALKLKSYFVTHFYDHFKDDPLLRQLFPAPAEPAKARLSGNLGSDAITRYRAARDAWGRKAEAVLKVMEGTGLERARRLLSLSRQDRGTSLLGLLNPNDMRERALVKRLREQGHWPALEEVVALVDKLQPAMTKAKEGGQYEPMEELIERLRALYASAAGKALEEVLPALPAEIG